MTIQFVFSTIPKTSSMNTSSRMQMNLNEWEWMNGWGFALSPPYPMLLFISLNISFAVSMMPSIWLYTHPK